MRSTKLKTRTEKGITLIALIITIVVLLILAVVAINSIQNYGIISHAGNTANTYNQAVKKEQSSLLDYEDMLTAANGGYETYEVGTEVTVAGENFYVIEDKTSLGKVVLLAKQNIIADKNNENYLTQSASAGKVVFSETAYWADDFTSSPYDLTETGKPDASHTAAKAAYDYGAKVDGNGRLMTYTEASALSKTDFSTKLYETSFWLGCAYDSEKAYIIHGSLGDLAWYSYNSNYFPGVRPVIEISISEFE
jgi:type II secretory pathway pseudopilin PulG